MKQKKSAFTLVEVLISITLLSLVLMALYKSSDLLRRSNIHLYHHLEHISDAMKGSQVLYLDMLQADSNISFFHKEKKFDQLIIEKTKHSLYGLSPVKVIWLVYKENNILLRIEGVKYQLPLKEDDKVEIDKISKDIELFKFYQNEKKSKLLVVIKGKGEVSQSFLIQNLAMPPFRPRIVSPSSIGKFAPKSR